VLPVTVAIARTPAPGREEDLVAWAHGVAEAAETFDGHLGARIIRAGDDPSADVVVAFSFDSTDHLNAWEGSRTRREWLDRLEGMVAGAATTHSVSGFEAIFADPRHSSPRGVPVVPPPRWKTAVIIALALYPMSAMLAWLLGPAMESWNLLLRSLVTTLIIVPYMAWIGVPYLSRWLRGWLHRA
jgi:antibiotic biosynthesis monooxygenase (ABM) superfamily enzyme